MSGWSNAVFNGIRYEEITRDPKEVYSLPDRTLHLTEKEFWALDERVRRKILEQVMFICTNTTFYCIGACGDFWTMVAMDIKHLWDRDEKGRRQVILYNYTKMVLDSWR